MQTRDKIPRKLRSSPVSARASLISPSFHGVVPLTGTRAYLHFEISTRFTTLPTSFLRHSFAIIKRNVAMRLDVGTRSIILTHRLCYITVVGVNTGVNNNAKIHLFVYECLLRRRA